MDNILRSREYSIVSSGIPKDNGSFYRTLMYDKKGNCVYTSLNNISDDKVIMELGDRNASPVKYIIKCSCPLKKKVLLTADRSRYFLSARYTMDIFNVKAFKEDTTLLLKDDMGRIIKVDVEVI